MSDLETIDFFTDNGLMADPYPYYEAVRAHGPVWREPHHNVVMVTGAEEAFAVLNNPEAFSSACSVTGPFPGFPVPLVGDDVSELIEAHRDTLPMHDQIITADPPAHTDQRHLLMRLLTPKRLKENEDAMSQLGGGVLDRFLAPGEGEFISGFASPFTFLVIADLLGVPVEDREAFQAGLNRPHAVGGLGATNQTEGETTMPHNPLEYLYEEFSAYVADRRQNPRDDVLTGMATATFPDGTVPEPIEVARVAANVFSAGQETTVRLLSAALLQLGEDPELQKRLRSDRELIPNFIEECLRFEGPVKGDFRVSRVPTTVAGVDLPAGTILMLVNGAAGRDPRVFPNPGTFDAERANARQHLAFGRGIHTCPGAPLARAEARVAVELMLRRTTDIRISEAAHGPADARRYMFVPTFILRGLINLNLEFDLA